MEASEEPIAITHGFAKALNEHDRGASDELIRAVGERGYIGVVLVPFLTDQPKATLGHFVRHVEHIANVVGIDHVGIGTDWAPPVPVRLRFTAEVMRIGFRPEHRVDWGATVAELDDWTDRPNITRALVHHGFSSDEVRGVAGRNLLRIFREACG